MELLDKYNEQEQGFIIQLGVLNYSKTREFLKSMKSAGKTNLVAEDIVSEYEKRLVKEKRRVEEVYETLLEERNNFSKILLGSTAELNSENKKIREDYVRLSESIMKEVAVSTETRTKVLDNVVIELKQELETRNKQIEEYKGKQGSAAKGLAFESNIYNNLMAILEETGNNWDIIHVGQKLGGKGDIILEHKDTGKRVMIDPKNHVVVPNAHKEKFLRDVKDIRNGFDVGIMVSNGKISGKRCFEKTTVGDKVVIYVSNFQLGQEGFILSLMEDLNNQVVNNPDNNLDKNKIMKKYLDDFERVKRQKNLCEAQLKIMTEQEEQLTGDYYAYFNQDIQIALLKDNKSLAAKDKKNDAVDAIYKVLDEGIVTEKDSKLELAILHDWVISNSLKATKRNITKVFNNWRKDKHDDARRMGKSIVGYAIKNSQVICVET
jgi:hypothetical protein